MSSSRRLGLPGVHRAYHGAAPLSILNPKLNVIMDATTHAYEPRNLGPRVRSDSCQTLEECEVLVARIVRLPAHRSAPAKPKSFAVAQGGLIRAHPAEKVRRRRELQSPTSPGSDGGHRLWHTGVHQPLGILRMRPFLPDLWRGVVEVHTAQDLRVDLVKLGEYEDRVEELVLSLIPRALDRHQERRHGFIVFPQRGKLALSVGRSERGGIDHDHDRIASERATQRPLVDGASVARASHLVLEGF